MIDFGTMAPPDDLRLIDDDLERAVVFSIYMAEKETRAKTKSQHQM